MIKYIKIVFSLLSVWSLSADAEVHTKPSTPPPQQPVSTPIFREYYPNPGIVEVLEPGNFSRVVAVAGPKGMYKSFFELLIGTRLVTPGGVWKGGKSLLVVEGNVIGGGPDSIKTLDYLILLRHQARLAGGRLIVLLGEEEAKLLANPIAYDNPALKAEMAKMQISLAQLVRPGVSNGITTRGMFLRSLPVAAKIGTWLFAHSGLYPNIVWTQFKTLTSLLLSQSRYDHSLILGKDSILTSKSWINNPKDLNLLQQRLIYNNFYGVVFGNQYKSIGAPGEVAHRYGRYIKVNVGMGPDEANGPGRLLIFVKPKQMESPGVPELSTMGPSGNLTPIN